MFQRVWDGEAPLKAVIKVVSDNTEGKNKLESVRFLANGIQFY